MSPQMQRPKGDLTRSGIESRHLPANGRTTRRNCPTYNPTKALIYYHVSVILRKSYHPISNDKFCLILSIGKILLGGSSNHRDKAISI